MYDPIAQSAPGGSRATKNLTHVALHIAPHHVHAKPNDVIKYIPELPLYLYTFKIEKMYLYTFKIPLNKGILKVF